LRQPLADPLRQPLADHTAEKIKYIPPPFLKRSTHKIIKRKHIPVIEFSETNHQHNSSPNKQSRHVSFQPTPSDRKLRSESTTPLITAPIEAYFKTSKELEMFYGNFYAESYSTKVTVGKALKSQHVQQWTEAIRLEIDMLLKGGTLVPVNPEMIIQGSTIIHSTMQLKMKTLQSGELDKFKARLCAYGNELYGNVSETYSPTISALAYATVLQIAIIDQMKMCTVDTVGAYLYQE
jgi:hypothetical protein